MSSHRFGKPRVPCHRFQVLNSRAETAGSADSGPRRGAILALGAFCLCVALTICAFTVDLGFILMATGEAQNSADAAALAAALELYPDPLPQTAIQLPLGLPIYQPVRPYPNVTPATAAAKFAASQNGIAEVAGLQLTDADITFAIVDNGVTVGPPDTVPVVDGLLELLNLRTPDHTFVNACCVKVRRDTTANGPLNLFFAPMIGHKNHELAAESMAVIHRGYGIAAGDKMLPFAMDVTVWNALRFTNGELNAVTLLPLGIDLDAISLSTLLGSSGLLSLLDSMLPLALSGSPIHVLDGFGWQLGRSDVTTGPDGIHEVVLLADQLHVTNKLGLLGVLIKTVQRIPSLVISLETGSTNGTAPSASRLNDVIRNGLSIDHIQRFTCTDDSRIWLPFSMQGYFEIPNECESALREIIGQPRILPLYATLPGTVNKVTDILGKSHQFQFVGWGAVVVTEVNLSGPLRYINVQPAIYARHTVMPAQGGHHWRTGSCMSDGVFTSPKLIK